MDYLEVKPTDVVKPLSGSEPGEPREESFARVSFLRTIGRALLLAARRKREIRLKQIQIKREARAKRKEKYDKTVTNTNRTS